MEIKKIITPTEAPKANKYMMLGIAGACALVMMPEIVCASGVEAIGESLKKELKALVTLAEGIFPYALCLLTLFSMFLSNGDVFARIKVGGHNHCSWNYSILFG